MAIWNNPSWIKINLDIIQYILIFNHMKITIRYQIDILKKDNAEAFLLVVIGGRLAGVVGGRWRYPER
jgi:hypothetical protein